jgi:AcrR family transcriptional regulator
MNPGRRTRTKPAAVRREELLDAAERLFLAHGVNATSVDEIVAAAEVAKGTFYLYFAAKEQVLAALRKRYVSAFRDTLATAIERRRRGDWPGRLNAWVAAAVKDQLDRSALHDVVFHSDRAGDRDDDNPIVDQLAELLRGGMEAGAWAVADERLTAVMLFHALHGAADGAAIAAGALDRKKLTAALTRFFRRAVGIRGVSGPGNPP